MELHERADGTARHQRRLQRQPRVDGRGARRPRTASGRGPAGARSRCSGRCSSSATAPSTAHRGVGTPLPRPASTYSSRSATRRRTWRPPRASRAAGRVTRSSRRGVPRRSRWLRQNVSAGDVVLVKASRGAALELVAEALLDEPTTHPQKGAAPDESNPARWWTVPADLPDRHPLRDRACCRAAATARRSATTVRPRTTPSAARPTMGGARHHPRRGRGLLRRQADHRCRRPRRRRCCCSSSSSGLGFVGFLDDFIKISRQRSLGLRSRAKMIGQTVSPWSSASWRCRRRSRTSAGRRPPSLHISFIRDYERFALPTVVVIVLIWFFVTGFSNAVNLTDGLDGLATGCQRSWSSRAYTLVNIWQNSQSCAHRGRRQVLRGARPARPRRGRCRDHRRLLRLPVVERLAGPDLHGRHRLAGPRRRARRPRDPDPHRAAAGHPRRPVRGRHPVGDDPGVGLQGQPGQRTVPASSGSSRPPGLPDGARCTTTSRCSAGSRSPS